MKNLSYGKARRHVKITDMDYTVQYSGRDLVKWLERLTANAEVATVLGSIQASSDTIESEGR
jgi:hypothetical protein